ncbi:hypothetical protein D3C76_1301240 [compost metagenome]
MIALKARSLGDLMRPAVHPDIPPDHISYDRFGAYIFHLPVDLVWSRNVRFSYPKGQLALLRNSVGHDPRHEIAKPVVLILDATVDAQAVLDVEVEFLADELFSVFDPSLGDRLLFLLLDVLREMLTEDRTPPLMRNIGIVQGLLQSP